MTATIRHPVSWSDGKVVILCPKMRPGTYNVRVHTADGQASAPMPLTVTKGKH